MLISDLLTPPNHVATRARAARGKSFDQSHGPARPRKASPSRLRKVEGPLTRIDYVDLMLVPLQHRVPLEQSRLGAFGDLYVRIRVQRQGSDRQNAPKSSTVRVGDLGAILTSQNGLASEYKASRELDLWYVGPHCLAEFRVQSSILAVKDHKRQTD